MRPEREKWSEKIRAGGLRVEGGRFELPPGEDCFLILLSGGSCELRPFPVQEEQEPAQTLNPGCLVLLGPQSGMQMQQTSHTALDLVGCHFPSAALAELRSMGCRDLEGMLPPQGRLTLYGSAQWTTRLRTLLALLWGEMEDPESPVLWYLGLLLQYAQKEYLTQGGSMSRPHNETVDQICAYLTDHYQQKLSLSEVAAQFYLSPYYLSRLFRRVTGQSIVDFINARRIEAAQRLLETTELSITAVAEQTGFLTAAHFRRVFRELLGVGPLQYRKGFRK